MGLRMRKSFTLCKGVRVNWGKAGASLSFGTRGLRHTIHTSGRRTSSVGIPGTGLSYVISSRGTTRKRSYSSPAYTNRQNLQAQRQQQHLDEKQNNALIVAEYEALIDSIKSIHKECDELINWPQINSLTPPFSFDELGPNQLEAISALDNYRPNILENAIKSFAAKKQFELEVAIDTAAKQDANDYTDWERLHELSERILSGDIDSYFEVINEMNPLEDLLEFGSDFEFGAETPDVLEVEFRVKSQSTIPTFSMSLTQTGKLSKKDLTKTAYYDLAQDYVCSCALRIASDMFALLPLSTVIVHAVDNTINNENGHLEDITVLSVAFEKEKFQSLNFESLDPSDSMRNFPCNMKFLKTTGFKPISRINDK